jgi:cobalt-zinc-cadmium efflux system membrane fusion protein
MVMNSNVGMHLPLLIPCLKSLKDHLHLELNVFEKDILKVKVSRISILLFQKLQMKYFIYAEVHLVGNQLKEMKERLMFTDI